VGALARREGTVHLPVIERIWRRVRFSWGGRRALYSGIKLVLNIIYIR
jgi:hypothetical protein